MEIYQEDPTGLFQEHMHVFEEDANEVFLAVGRLIEINNKLKLVGLEVPGGYRELMDICDELALRRGDAVPSSYALLLYAKTWGDIQTVLLTAIDPTFTQLCKEYDGVDSTEHR